MIKIISSRNLLRESAISAIKCSFAALLVTGMLVFGEINCRAACSLESISLDHQNGNSILVKIQTQGDSEITTEKHPDKLVLYLGECSAPPGSHSIPGDGAIVKQVRWNYKATPNAVWVVIEHSSGALYEFKKKKDGQVLVIFSTDRSPAQPKKSRYIGSHGEIPVAIQERMAKYSWREQCPVGLNALSYLTVTHWGYDGKIHQGELVVNQKVAGEVVNIFRDLFDRKFPVSKMRLIEEYQGDDDASMADNNSSAFNCRFAKGSKNKYSKHSHGLAIDINPLVNPYVKNNRVSPKGGADYLDRTAKAKGMIVKGGPCYNAFETRGWQWGGEWKSLKDYQHFEKP